MQRTKQRAQTQEVRTPCSNKCTSKESEQEKRAATSVDWFLLLWTTRVLFSGVMGASEQDFRIFSFPFGGGLFCLLANLSGALHQYSPVEPVPLRSPVRVSACGCGESYGVTAGRMLDGQTQETAVMREEQEKIVITTWKQI
jgi:hypothetical protein